VSVTTSSAREVSRSHEPAKRESSVKLRARPHRPDHVTDEEADQSVNRHAFAVFYTIIRERLALRRFTIADSTGLEEFARARLLALGRRFAVPVHLVAFRASLPEILEHDAARTRRVPHDVLVRHARVVAEILEEGVLERAGYDVVHIVEGRAAPRPVRNTDRLR
jgi:predicted kinase